MGVAQEDAPPPEGRGPFGPAWTAARRRQEGDRGESSDQTLSPCALTTLDPTGGLSGHLAFYWQTRDGASRPATKEPSHRLGYGRGMDRRGGITIGPVGRAPRHCPNDNRTSPRAPALAAGATSIRYGYRRWMYRHLSTIVRGDSFGVPHDDAHAAARLVDIAVGDGRVWSLSPSRLILSAATAGQNGAQATVWSRR
jgi:hypothetical protein